jgi:hypothetical protein
MYREHGAAYRKRKALNVSRPITIPGKMPQAQDPPPVLPFDPLLNSLQIQPSTELPAKRRRTGEHATALDAVKFAVGLVEDEFELRAAASEAFLPDITSSHIRTSVSRYKDEISSVSERSVYYCCGRLIAPGDIYEVCDEARLILPLQYTLDHCGRGDNSWDFCTICHSAASRGSIPKFSASNLVNVITCQAYLSVLEDLTAIEECLIAKCHPVGVILKL